MIFNIINKDRGNYPINSIQVFVKLSIGSYMQC